MTNKFRDWMQAIAEAIMNAFRRLFGLAARTTTATARVAWAGTKGAAVGAGHIVDGSLQIAGAVITAVPKAILGRWAQRVPPAPHEDPRGNQAAANKVDTVKQGDIEAKREASVEVVDVARLARRYASASVAGRPLPELDALPPDVRAWVGGLSPEALAVLAETELRDVVRHVTGASPLETLPAMGSAPGAAAPATTKSERAVFRKPENGFARKLEINPETSPAPRPTVAA